jgi:hypothetical protein
MNAYLYVSGESTQQRVIFPTPQSAQLAEVFPWVANDLDEGLALTIEILSEPGALEEIMAALADLDSGAGVSGVDAVRALRPRSD